jgi:hypothetical protein
MLAVSVPMRNRKVLIQSGHPRTDGFTIKAVHRYEENFEKFTRLILEAQQLKETLARQSKKLDALLKKSKQVIEASEEVKRKK